MGRQGAEGGKEGKVEVEQESEGDGGIGKWNWERRRIWKERERMEGMVGRMTDVDGAKKRSKEQERERDEARVRRIEKGAREGGNQ